MNLTEHISSLIKLSKELEKELLAVSKQITVAKNSVLVKEGERCKHLYFMNKGIVRGFYFDNGKEITHWFAQEDDFATSFYSFITHNPSPETIETLEDCELTQISFDDLQRLYTKFPETERVGRIITENYYIYLEERFLNIQFKSAKERYQNLLEENSKLIQRVSLGQIASYLGITQETLSRVRAEL
jgi:CRP-like cAMP-binding protein